jgi:hypothetical protein
MKNAEVGHFVKVFVEVVMLNSKDTIQLNGEIVKRGIIKMAKVKKQDALFNTIAGLENVIFTTQDLLKTDFKDTNPSNLSASICNLVRQGLVWRIGRQVKNGKSYMFYTTDKSKANPNMDQEDRTSNRGRKSEPVHNREKIQALESENKKLVKKICHLEKILNILLGKVSKESLFEVLMEK